MLSPQEVACRLPVWVTLSELFVDNEITAAHLALMAQTLGASGYSRAELHDILRDEVAPVFGVNLRSVAGNWTGWRDDDVRELVLEHLANQRHWVPKRFLRWWREHSLGLVKPEWQQVLALLPDSKGTQSGVRTNG